MADGYVLSENAKRQMRDVYRFYQDHRSAPPAAPDWPANTEPPRSIIVKTPVGGISARSGTTVSSASCDVFKLVSGVLTDTAINETIWNLTETAVPAGEYVIANQTRYGTWAIVNSAAESECCLGCDNTTADPQNPDFANYVSENFDSIWDADINGNGRWRIMNQVNWSLQNGQLNIGNNDVSWIYGWRHAYTHIQPANIPARAITAKFDMPSRPNNFGEYRQGLTISWGVDDPANPGGYQENGAGLFAVWGAVFPDIDRYVLHEFTSLQTGGIDPERPAIANSYDISTTPADGDTVVLKLEPLGLDWVAVCYVNGAVVLSQQLTEFAAPITAELQCTIRVSLDWVTVSANRTDQFVFDNYSANAVN